MKKILVSLALLSLICVVLVQAETITTCREIMCAEGSSSYNTGEVDSYGCPVLDCSPQTTSSGVSKSLCAKEGEYIYKVETEGSTSCCSGLINSGWITGDNFQTGETITRGTCVKIQTNISSCIVGCVCTGETMTCPSEQQPTITTIVQSGILTNSVASPASATISMTKTISGGTSIQSGNVEVLTSEKVFVTNSKLIMQTTSGSSKEIKVMPEEISEILGTSTIKSIELKEESEKAVYSVSGTKQAKVIAVFPVDMKIQTKVSAETGEIISMEKPWWSFLAKEE